MSLPTFSELLASLHLGNAGEFEADSPIDAEVDSETQAMSPSPRSLISPTNPTRHTRSTSSASSSSSSGSIKHLPSSSPSHNLIIKDLNFKANAAFPSSSISPADSEAITSNNNNSSSRLTRHSTRSINRFTPYLGASKTVHIRRGSLPDDLQLIDKHELPDRPSTVSPRLLSSALQLQLEDIDINIVVDPPPLSPPLPLPPPAAPAPSKLIHIDIENRPDVPISSFARRKTPQSSPTLTDFRQRRRNASFSPVLLPTLLPGLPAVNVSSPDMALDLCEAVATKLAATTDSTSPRVVRQHGLRLSSYRSFYVSRTRTTVGTSYL